MSNETKLFFTKSVYPRQIVFDAAVDYESICSIQIDSVDAGTICTFSHCTVNKDLVVKEFGNYLIELLNAGSYRDNY